MVAQHQIGAAENLPPQAIPKQIVFEPLKTLG